MMPVQSMARRSMVRWSVAAIVAVGLAYAVACGSAHAETPRRDELNDPGDPDDGLLRDGSPPNGVCIAHSGTTCGELGAPTVDEVVAAAYAASGLAHDPASGWIRRGRLSALVPWVALRAGRDTSWVERDPSVGHGASYEVRMTWRLDRLAFDSRELQVASVEAARRRERRRLAARVIRVYFTWLRAHRAMSRDPRWGIHAAEAGAELDALTDGAFTRQLHRAGGS